MATLIAEDGVGLYAESHGDGIPVILSNGLGTTCENFRPQVATFVDAGVQLILWDYRGHGRSESPDDPAAYTFDRVLSDLGRVLDWAAPGRRVVLGGISFGGLASLHFAHRNPERVRALIVIATGPGFKDPEARARWSRRTEKSASLIESEGASAFVKSRAASSLIGLRPDLPVAQAAASAIARQDPVGLVHFQRQIAAKVPSIIDGLREIDCPALVVVGEKDDAFLRAADVMEARLPRAERETISGAGHMVNIDESEALDAVALKFIGKITAETPD
ncbi:MAG: alpha/beta fold hydrolase [Deltaproteobacteria bacterium]|nr:alpha/beta fold hydrolase [Deltaproteobacteria bacterium]